MVTSVVIKSDIGVSDMKTSSSSIFFRLTGAFVIMSLTACASHHNEPPRAVMPPTPAQFLVATKNPSDRSLNCDELLRELRYTFVMIESVNRVFEARGPVLMRESSYATTTGMSVRTGDLNAAYSTTTAIGGGGVAVYSDLSYRAMQITDAQRRRRSELQYLVRANGCENGLKNSGQEDYAHYIREAESEFRSALRDHKRWIEAVRESQERLVYLSTPEMKRLGSEDLSERMRLRDEFKEAANAAQIILDKLVAESKEAYARAENSAIEMRKWFEVNTKLP